jgi:hypothetical protein
MRGNDNYPKKNEYAFKACDALTVQVKDID